MKPGRKKGTPKTGGRRKGTPNKVSAAIREVALQHGPDAIQELVRLMKRAEKESVRIAACREILDRAYGRPRQTMEHEHTGEVAHRMDITSLSAREKMRRLALFMLEDKAAGEIIDGESNPVDTTNQPDATD